MHFGCLPLQNRQGIEGYYRMRSSGKGIQRGCNRYQNAQTNIFHLADINHHPQCVNILHLADRSNIAALQDLIPVS